MLMRSRSGALVRVSDEAARGRLAAHGFTEVKPKDKPKPKRKPRKKD